MPNLTEQFLGTWRLVSFEMELQNSAQRFKPWGDDPNGHVVLAADGRMIALLTAGTRKPGETDSDMANLFRTLVAYTGIYRIDGERLITKVDGSWNEAWNGTEQERFYHFDGDRLVLTTAWALTPFLPGTPMARGVLAWKRAQ
ncbi:MAG: lipocalin-like domain-containing protein [Rhodocyclaceae bacterium]|nr:lipocalin-like domain-containing protein [Rhodocyclaceae bacterium]